MLHPARPVLESTAPLLVLLPLLGSAAAAPQDPDAVLRGEYVFHAGACDSCHTDHPHHGAFLAGGRRMDTEFGTFYVPNITPDVATGSIRAPFAPPPPGGDRNGTCLLLGTKPGKRAPVQREPAHRSLDMTAAPIRRCYAAADVTAPIVSSRSC